MAPTRRPRPVRLSIVPVPSFSRFKNANLNKTRPPLHSAGTESCRKRCRFLGHQSLVWCISNDLAMLPIPPRAGETPLR